MRFDLRRSGSSQRFHMMMCICRRCAREMAAMDDDLLAYVTEEVADLWDEAFQCATAYGYGMVGIEHLVVALTSVPAGVHLLEQRGVDILMLQSSSLWLVAAGADAGHGAHQPIEADDDLNTALALAVEIAHERHGGPAGCEELMAALDCYEAADAGLAHVMAMTRAPGVTARAKAHERAEERVTASAGAMHHVRTWENEAGIARAAGASPSQTPLHADATWSDSLALRLAELEREFSQRLAQLTQQVEDDRQRIAYTLRELSRQRERLPQADDWRSQMQEIVVRLDALAQRQRDAELALRRQSGAPEADRDAYGERSVAGLSQLAPQQQTHAPIEDGAGTSSRLYRRPHARAFMDAAGVQMHGIRRVLGRGARRLRRRFGSLRYASIRRAEMKRRPVRRERSWWCCMTDAKAWRAARRKGGHFRRFGERHQSARRRRSRTTVAAMRPSHHLRASHNTAAVAVIAAVKSAEVSEKRFYLSLDDDIVDAPSIGPRTAERLRPARLFTVRDLLAADPDEVGMLVTARHITAAAVRDWQDQARLVITVPFLRGTHAQLLVGAGFRSATMVATADHATLMSALLTFATSRNGQGILRNGPPPDIEKVLVWMRNAADADVARAA